MELYRHQENFLFSRSNKKLLCWDTGTGKTLTAVLFAAHRAKPYIVVCPKAIRENWMRSCNEHSPNIPSMVISKEEFRRDAKKLEMCHTIIIDEAHYFSGMKSQMSKSLLWYVKKHSIPNVLLLTATPYMSTPWNIYRLAQILGHEWSYIRFREQFFQDRYIGNRAVPQVRPGMQNEVSKLVSTIGSVIRLDDCADVPEQVFEKEFFSITDEQKKAIEDHYDTSPIVRYTAYHQIENGCIRDSDGFTNVYECGKIDRINELCCEFKKVAIVCRYNAQIDVIKKKIGDSIDKPIFVIRGDVKDRDSVVSDIEKADECVVIINASCSEGYELPSIGRIVFASMSFSYKDYKQMIGRFLRINKLKKNSFIHLLVSGGIDEAVYNSIMNKKDFDIAIYEKKVSDQ